MSHEPLCFCDKTNYDERKDENGGFWRARRVIRSEKCSNRLQLDIISLLVNFSCDSGHNDRYDILRARQLILSNVRTDFNLT